jgi:hypothetical protein
LALLCCAGALAVATSASSRSSDKQLVTFHVEIGRNGTLIAEADLRVGGDDISSYSRHWPVEALETCTRANGNTQHAGANNAVSIDLEPVRPPGSDRGRKPFEHVLVRGSWTEILAMNPGSGDGTCGTWPLHRGEVAVSRTVPIDLPEPVTLTGDDGLYVTVTRLR